MKVRTINGKSVDLSPLQLKLALHCFSHHTLHFGDCIKCKYDYTCTHEYFIPLSDTPNGTIIPKNFNTRIHTNNYRKLNNLPKKRKGADYFD